MEIEIRKHSDLSYTLYVNGEATVRRESYQIVDNIAAHLRDIYPFDGSECAQVAESIRSHYDGEDA